ncbi:MAG: type IV pilus secretin PilQ [Nitrospirae bacterium]|nr:type IV pilus secretin PilQ [Nitrospirota bacterium]
MKIFNWCYRIMIFGIISIGLISCGLTSSMLKSSSKEKNKINSIKVMDYADKTEIVIEGDKAISYTAFSLTDPLRYVVDLSGISSGNYKEKIDVNLGSVTSIVPIENAQPFKAVRLEIGLLNQVEPAIRKEGLTLVVDIPKKDLGANPPEQVELTKEDSKEKAGSDSMPGFNLTPSAISTSETSASSEGSKDTAPAAENQASGPSPEEKQKVATRKNHVESIKVDQTEQTVDVMISGEFSAPRVFKLKGNRLVIDINGATQEIRPLIQKVHLPPVEKIRIGQHPAPKKVRIVLDLSENVPFTTESDENVFTVHLMKSGVPQPVSQANGETAVQNEPESKNEVAKEEKPSEPSPPEAAAPAPPQNMVKRPKKGNILFVERTQTTRKRYVGEKIFLNFQDTEISNVLRIISEVSGFNFVIGDEVKGKVNLKLKNVPWDQALDLVLKMNNLGQIREGNIIRVTSLANITKQQDDELKVKDSQIKTEDLVTQVIHVNYAKAVEMMEPLKKNMSSRGEITADIRTNSLVIKDIEKNINQVADLIKTLDSRTPQVLIEARIVQVSPTYTQSLGVQWGAQTSQVINNNTNQIGITSGISGPFNAQTPGFAVNLPAASPFGGVGFSFGTLTGNPLNLDLRISAGEARGLTKIISTPKIAVLDNMEAKIEQGESIPFATTSLSGTQTTFVDANLTLTVTPHVTADGSVIMKINTAKNAPGSTRQGAAGPSILKKQASTNILVKDGDTAVIGGIYETSKADSTSGVPILSKIPILGWFFKNHQVDENTSELLVFLTPKIMK